MSIPRVGFRCLGMWAGLLLALGCRTAAPVSVSSAPPVSPELVSRNQTPATKGTPPFRIVPSPEIVQTAHLDGEPAPAPAADVDATESQVELQLDLFVADVLRRNPTLQVAAATWQAASQRYPQVVALDDPMLETMFGPAAWGDDNLDGAYSIGVSQKIPWKGKLELKGQMALWDTNAAKWDSVDVQVQLTEAAKIAYFEYYLAERQLEVNRTNTSIMEEFRDIAQSRLEVNLSPQQDVLQADVELGELARRRLELEQRRETAIARINTLLHRSPLEPLPPAPADLPLGAEITPDDAMLAVAIQRRQDLAALASRIQSERAAVSLASKEFYPDFELMARYDAFWQEKPLRPMVGVNLNIPLNHEKRHAAVDEATFNVYRLQAEYARQVDGVLNDVKSAQAKLVESRRAVDLYRDQILPAAEVNVESARAGYEASQIDFLRLIEAQRQLNDLQEQFYQAIAAYHMRLAELERLVGGQIVQRADRKRSKSQLFVVTLLRTDGNDDPDDVSVRVVSFGSR
jgi:outer membrane protein TolC